MREYLVALLITGSICLATVVSAQPTEEWVARHNGSANSWDLAQAITLDDEGNIYVTGRSTYSGAMKDIVTIKYTPDGAQDWLARYSGPANLDDGGADICVDDSAYVYVTGYCDASIGGSEWVTIKYDQDGNEVWNRVYPSGSGSSVVVDSQRNVIVVGVSLTTNAYDCTTIKYGPDGTELWVRFYNGPVDVNDYGEDVALDGVDNIYVAATINDGGIGVYADYGTIKYDPDGQQMWVAIYDPSGQWADTANEIELDEDGNVYVFGSSSLTEVNADFALVRYDSSDGGQIWDARYNGGSTDLATGMALDPFGNIVVTGGSMISGMPGHYDYVTIKHDPAGSQLWIRQYDGPGNNWDWPYGGVAADGEGVAYVTGRSVGAGGDYDYGTVAYGPGGAQLWVMRYDGPASGQDYGDGGVAVDSDYNVYVTGNSAGVGTSADYATIKYSGLGAMVLQIELINSTTARLSWDAVLGATNYDLYRNTTPFFSALGSAWQTVADPTTQVDFTAGIGDESTNYFFLGKVRSASQTSPESNIAGEYDFAADIP